MKGRGFTLIELLVVIAIIAILAAILFPVFLAAKVAGQTSACSSNVRQIAQGVILYADDFSGHPPPIWQIKVKWTEFWGWLRNVRPYIRGRNVFYCPAYKKLPNIGENPQTGQHDSSYSVNLGVFGASDDTNARWDWDPRAGFNNTLGSFRRQSKMLMVIEEKDNMSYSHFWMLYESRTDPNTGQVLHELYTHWPTYHNYTVNIGFVDGHVKAMRLRKTISLDPDANMWEDVGHHHAGTWTQIQSAIQDMINKWPADYPQ